MILLEVPAQDGAHHAIANSAVANLARFEEQEHSTGGIAVGVGIAADLVDKVMAEGQLAKHLRGTWRFLAKPLELRPDRLRDDEMLRVGLTVYEQSPVDIAPFGHFTASQRPERHEGAVGGHEPFGR